MPSEESSEHNKYYQPKENSSRQRKSSSEMQRREIGRRRQLSRCKEAMSFHEPSVVEAKKGSQYRKFMQDTSAGETREGSDENEPKTSLKSYSNDNSHPARPNSESPIKNMRDTVQSQIVDNKDLSMRALSARGFSNDHRSRIRRLLQQRNN